MSAAAAAAISVHLLLPAQVSSREDSRRRQGALWPRGRPLASPAC